MTNSSPGRQKKLHQIPGYEIRIRGTISPDLAEWLDPVDIQNLENGETILVYQGLDEAALYGILIRLRDLGLNLLSVQPVSNQP